VRRFLTAPLSLLLLATSSCQLESCQVPAASTVIQACAPLARSALEGALRDGGPNWLDIAIGSIGCLPSLFPSLPVACQTTPFHDERLASLDPGAFFAAVGCAARTDHVMHLYNAMYPNQGGLPWSRKSHESQIHEAPTN